MNIFTKTRSLSVTSNESVDSSNSDLSSNGSSHESNIENDEFLDKEAADRDANRASEKYPGDTDAVLSCPSCFTQICFTCQAHTRYEGQYRALTVEHCNIIDSQKYTFNSRGKLTEIKTDDRAMAPSNSKDVYKLVVCKICKNKVGVLDHKDVYHLFQVIPDIQK